jgi:hypothetical protein
MSQCIVACLDRAGWAAARSIGFPVQFPKVTLGWTRRNDVEFSGERILLVFCSLPGWPEALQGS